MNKTLKRVSALILAALIMAILASFVISENAYAAVKLSNKSLIIGKGAKFSLKVTGTKKKVKWSSTKKSIATVSKKGVVKGKKIGSCYIKAKVAGKTLKCKVAVKKPAVANAMNLGKYILANGKKAKDGGYYIRKKWDDEFGSEHQNDIVKAYKDKTEMYFETKDYEVEGDDYDYKLIIDLIKQKPGNTEAVYGYFSACSDEYYYGTVDYSLHYDSEDDTACKGAATTKIEIIDYDYSNGQSTSTEYTDPSYLSQPSKVRGACARAVYAFERFDNVFKKYKLKSRMKNLGFSNL
jgi:hypothetical protein